MRFCWLTSEILYHSNIIRCRFYVVSFLQNAHSWHPTTRSWGRCYLWLKLWFMVELDHCSAVSCYVWPCYDGTRLYLMLCVNAGILIMENNPVVVGSGLVRKKWQAITWHNANSELRRHMLSLGCNELKCRFNVCQISIYWFNRDLHSRPLSSQMMSNVIAALYNLSEWTYWSLGDSAWRHNFCMPLQNEKWCRDICLPLHWYNHFRQKGRSS